MQEERTSIQEKQREEDGTESEKVRKSFSAEVTF